MDNVAGRMIDAIYAADEEFAKEAGTGRYTAEVKRWDGPGSFQVDVMGLDLDLDEGFVTLSQAVRAYDQTPGVDVGDNLVLVEVDEGEFVAVGVESSTALPDPVDGDAIQDSLDSLDVRLDVLEGTHKAAWPFASGWANYGSGQEPCTYSKHGKSVTVQGAFTKTSGAPGATNVIATLPAGFQPTGELYIPTVTGPSGNTFGAVSIQPDGDIVWRAGSAVETDFTSFAVTFEVD
jgi:hypothetical protein